MSSIIGLKPISENDYAELILTIKSDIINYCKKNNITCNIYQNKNDYDNHKMKQNGDIFVLFLVFDEYINHNNLFISYYDEEYSLSITNGLKINSLFDKITKKRTICIICQDTFSNGGMCSRCSTFYCIKCRDSIYILADNKCSICKSFLC